MPESPMLLAWQVLLKVLLSLYFSIEISASSVSKSLLSLYFPTEISCAYSVLFAWDLELSLHFSTEISTLFVLFY